MNGFQTFWGKCAKRWLDDDELMQYEERLAMLDDSLTEYECEKIAFCEIYNAKPKSKSFYTHVPDFYKYNLTFKKLRVLNIHWEDFKHLPEMNVYVVDIYKKKVTELYYRNHNELLDELDIKFCKTPEGQRMIRDLQVYDKTVQLEKLRNKDLNAFINLKKELVALKSKKFE